MKYIKAEKYYLLRNEKKIKWQIPELDAILTNNRNTLNVLELEATKANQVTSRAMLFLTSRFKFLF